MKQVEAQEMLVSQELDLLFVVWITYHQQLLQTTQPQATQQTTYTIATRMCTMLLLG
jgi:hypothetical protein